VIVVLVSGLVAEVAAYAETVLMDNPLECAYCNIESYWTPPE
jgi:hypothetical protein